MHRLMLVAAVAALPLPSLAEDRPILSCQLEKLCIAGQTCAGAVEAFALEPVPGGYGASIDGGRVEVMQVSPPEARVQTFIASGAQSVTVLLSLFPGGGMALTMHENIDGPYVETAFGACLPESM